MLVLPIDTYSPDQLSELVLELQDLAAAWRDSSVRKQGATETATSTALSELLAANKVAANDIAAVETLAKDVAATLDSAPTVHILLSAMPGRALRRQFATWFRTQISPLTLMTFAARSDIGGGAIVHAGSQLYDLSFRRTILENKSRLMEIASV